MRLYAVAQHGEARTMKLRVIGLDWCPELPFGAVPHTHAGGAAAGCLRALESVVPPITVPV